MMRRTKARSSALALILPTAAVALLCLCAPAALADLKADYRLEGSRTSAVPGAPDLRDIDTSSSGDNVFATENVGGPSRLVLTFPRGNGLEVATGGVIPRTDYSVLLQLRLAEISGYRRIVDLSGGVSDNGLYNLNGTLVFFGSASGTATPITPSASGDPYHQVLLQRDTNGRVAGYVNGVEQFRFDDAANRAVIHPGQTLRFFKDDSAVEGEESAGAVAGIQLHDAPLVLPPLVPGKTVNVGRVSGTVLIGEPAGSGSARTAQKGVRFVPLRGIRQISVGSFLNARRGTVRLFSAANATGKTQSGDFRGGTFQVRQSRRGRPVTELRLKGSSFRRCRRRARGGRGASTAQRRRRRRLSRRTIRRLRGRARGRFRSRGRHSSATVRGTTWTIADRCDGTLTRVRRGRVVVRDFRRKKRISLRRGKSYLARARR